MKQNITLTTLLAFILIACNTQTNYNKTLIQADSLMISHPDSALAILESIPISELTNEEDSAYYGLLMTQAQYKNFITLTNDSSIQKAVSYYDRVKNLPMQAKAYYYLGCTFYDMNECDKSLKAYNEAIILAKKNKNQELLGFIYNSIGYLYQVQNMDNKADSIYKLTEQLAKQTKDTLLWAESLTRQGIYSISLGENYYEKAENQILKSYNLSKTAQLLNKQNLSILTLSTLYNRMHNHEKALSFAKEYLSFQKNDSTELARANLQIGDTYYQIMRYDSASIYLHKSLNTNSNSIKEGVCMRLADIARIRQDFEQVLKWEEERISYHEKQIQSQQKTEIALTEKEIEQEKEKQLNHSQLYTYLTYILTESILIVGILIFTNIEIQRRKKRKIAEITLLQETNTEEVHQKALKFEEFKNTISNKDYMLKILRIIKYAEKYSDHQEHFEKSDQLKFLQDIDALLENYTFRLKAKFPLLNDKDIFFCCLCLLDLSDTQIGFILERDRSNTFRKRKNILKKMNNDTNNIENILKRL